MKRVLYILLVQCIIETSFKRTATVSQKERINILKQKIQEEIRSKTHATDLVSPLDIEDSSIEALQHEINEHLPITPILENFDRKKSAKFKSSALTTVKFDIKIGGNKGIDKSQDGDKGKGNASYSHLRSKYRIPKKKLVKKPLEIFYRRLYNTEFFDKQLEWVHCQDIITPFLTGAKLNISEPKVFHSNHPTVLRLLSLLKVDTTSYGREDIYSILYQISNLNLRFFRWDVSSMKMLFNVIIKEKKHTLGSLKHGLRDLFNKWRLEFSNSTALLRQARIFRPPCVAVATDGGSTKSPKVTKYPKKTKPTTPCEDYDDCKH